MRFVLTSVRFFDRRPRWLLLLLTAASLVPLAFIDRLTGYQPFFGFFYLAPISFAAWHVGPRWAALFSAASVAAWALGVHAAGGAQQGWLLYGHACTRLAAFLLITVLLSTLRTAQDREARLARTDSLTGVANNRCFHEQLDREILRCRRYHHPFTVIYGDLDNFKVVNDRLGHAAGDALLQDVAEAMKRGVRGTDIVARLGGDEFAALLPETGEAAGAVVVQQLRQRLLETIQHHRWPIGGSFGVVTCVDPPANADAVLNLADELMYAAKREGTNRVRHAVLATGAAPAHEAADSNATAKAANPRAERP